MDNDDCCGGFTIDTTVGEVNITIHSHAFFTPEVLDSFLKRTTFRATAAEAHRFKAVHETLGTHPTDTTDQA